MTPPNDILRVRARWVVTMAGPALVDGAVLIEQSGRVAAVGPDLGVPRPGGAVELDLADAIVFPGLINTHTHLELTGFEHQIDQPEFPRWIRTLRELKATRSPADYEAAARHGVRDAFASGITTVADTGDSGAVLPALTELGGSGVVYQEVFGPDPAQKDESLAGLERRVAELAASATPRTRLGVSPHAPYTVSGPLFRATANFARAHGLPLAVHLAESREETALVTSHRGPFAEAWTGRRIPPLADRSHRGQGNSPSGGPPERSPVAWLDYHGVLGPATLAIHVVQADAADLAILRERDVAIAHCPVSNRSHGHGAAPLGEFLERGIRVGVGTDSVVSVGSLNLFEEIRQARALASLGASDALALATTGAAEALGLGREIGRLAVGYFGDFTAITADDPVSDPVEAIVRADPSQVLLTAVGGRVSYRRRDPA